MCNPKDQPKLAGINTESCEQTFRWVNGFTSVKSMNESRYWMFFLAVFDYHNLHNLGNGHLRSVAHPQSSLRWETLPNRETDFEASLFGYSGADDLVTLDEPDELDSLTPLLQNLGISTSDDPLPEKDATLKCPPCPFTYKKPWTLRTHLRKKHDIIEEEATKEPKFTCEICMESFRLESEYEEHKPVHMFVCKICNERFWRESEYEAHKPIHVICDICQ